MGDKPPLPLGELMNWKTDTVATGTTGIALFKVIPWAEIAAFLACLYWIVRIVLAIRERK